MINFMVQTFNYYGFTPVVISHPGASSPHSFKSTLATAVFPVVFTTETGAELLNYDVYVTWGVALLVIGGLGAVFASSNLLVLFMALEVYLIGLAFLFIVTGVIYASVTGILTGYLLLVVAGCETAVALALITAYFFVVHDVSPGRVAPLRPAVRRICLSAL